jgi:hypothetical protein
VSKAKRNISTEEFFEALYPDLDGHYLEIRKVPSGSQHFCRTIEESVAECQSLTKDVFFGLGLRANRSGSISYESPYPAMVVKFDHQEYGKCAEKSYCLEPSFEPVDCDTFIAWQCEEAFCLRPSIAVSDEQGVTVYWLFEQPFTIWDATVCNISAIFDGITMAMPNQEAGILDYDRAYRVPEIGGVRVIDWHPDRRYAASDFNPWKEPGAVRPHLYLKNPEGLIRVDERRAALREMADTLCAASQGGEIDIDALLERNERTCVPVLEETEVREIASEAWEFGTTTKC